VQHTYLCPTATTSFMILLETFLLRKFITVSIAATWSLIGTCSSDDEAGTKQTKLLP